MSMCPDRCTFYESRADSPFSVLTVQTEKPSAAELKAQGASVVAVDYDSPASLVAALKGVEVVISAIGGHDFSVQKVIANAAKEAGVQVFVPRFVFSFLDRPCGRR